MVNFKIDDLASVVILGASSVMNDIIAINEDMGLDTKIITCPDQNHGLPSDITYVTESLDKECENFLDQALDRKKTLFISIGARWIFKSHHIHDMFHRNLVNFHGARLPYDAGAGSLSWRILKNDRINNMLVHCVDEGIDTGDILSYKTSLFPSYCKIPQDFIDVYRQELLLLYSEFVKDLKSGKSFCRIKQTAYNGTYYPRLNTELNAWIDWHISDDDIYRFINAFDDPYGGAATFLNDSAVRLKGVHRHGGEQNGHPFMAGMVMRCHKDWVVVQTASGDQCLIVEKVLTKDGENILSSLKAGDRFHTPSKYLDDAMSTRVKYNSKGLVSHAK